MSSRDFHDNPYDEGTLTKLTIFEWYTQAWLPVFLSQESPRRSEIHIYDFFAGPGLDSNGVPGSPLRILKILKRCQTLGGWAQVRIHVHFYDKSIKKIAQLKINVDRHKLSAGNIHYDIQVKDFTEGFKISENDLAKANAAKLVFIDQTGVANVTEDVFRTIVNAPSCDFLFFISSSTLHRFRNHPAIRQKISHSQDYYHVHRAVLDYYRKLLQCSQSYYLAPFSIKKRSNIYGIIFGSAHPLGIDKFLQVAWKQNEINGEADFDINRENFRPGQLYLPLEEVRSTKLSAFESELENLLRKGVFLNEADVMRMCFENGVKRQHAKPVLVKLKKEGVIDLEFQTPNIKNIWSPRPIYLKKR